MNIIAHDFETTGTDPRTCGVVQSAIAIVEIDIRANWEVIALETALHHPGCPIPKAASNVHGITDEMVKGRPDYEESIPPTYQQAMTEFQPYAVLGYNSNTFDNVIARRLGMPSEGLTEIDMMIAARRLMTMGHLQRARLVDAYEGLVGKPAENAHDAMADVMMTLALIKPVMRIMGFEGLPELVGWLSEPQIDTEMLMPFGKHKGSPLSITPRSYLTWLLNKGGLDQDMHGSVQAVLNA